MNLVTINYLTNEKVNVQYVDGNTIIVPHPESKDRVQKINGAIIKTGLGRLMLSAGSITLSRSEILKIHDEEYVKEVEHYCQLNKEHRFYRNSDMSINNIDSLASIYAAIASVLGAVQLSCSGCKVRVKDIELMYEKENKTPPIFKNDYPRRVFLQCSSARSSC